jgi:hypothetical protein
MLGFGGARPLPAIIWQATGKRAPHGALLLDKCIDFSTCRDYIDTMAMNKRMISLTDPQVEWLQREADRLKVSVADLIRRIIDQHREERVEKK